MTATLAKPSADFGRLLKEWRGLRRMSQLELALEANVSARHISFIETGRSRPSRQMVLQIAQALEVPLRSRNLLLSAAGYSETYRESALDDPEVLEARAAIKFLLDQHEPYPAVVFDRLYRLQMLNAGAMRLFAEVLGPPPEPDGPPADGFDTLMAMRPVLANWEQVASGMVIRMRRAVAASPGDTELAALHDRMVAEPELAALAERHSLAAPVAPLVPVELRLGEIALRFITTIATFGTPQDVTLQELRIESFFPADEATRRWLAGD